MNLTSDSRWRFLTAVHAFNAVSALAGGGLLALWPDGHMLQAPLKMLEPTPFSSFLFPGLVLFSLVGVTNLIAAMAAFRREHGAEVLSFVAGLCTVGWIAGELLVLRVFDPLQVVYAVTGLLLMLDAGWIHARPATLQPARVAVRR